MSDFSKAISGDPYRFNRRTTTVNDAEFFHKNIWIGPSNNVDQPRVNPDRAKPVIKTINPAGGGNYTSLQEWWDDVKTAKHAAQWAKCYPGNLGVLNMSGNTFVPDYMHFPRIFAADGSGAGTSYNSNKPRIECGANSIGISMQGILLDYTQIDGITFLRTGTGAALGITINENSNVVISRCGFWAVAGTSRWSQCVHQAIDNTVSGLVVYNCVMFLGSTSSPVGIELAVTSGDQSLSASIYNNTISYTGTGGAKGIYIDDSSDESAGTLNVTITNNIVLVGSGGTAIRKGTSGQAPTFSGSNNLTSDTTASANSLTAGVVNQTNTDVLTIPASDLSLKSGSNAIDAGATLASLFTTDILGISRPQGNAWDIGAAEKVF